jgi:hypothetical protein
MINPRLQKFVGDMSLEGSAIPNASSNQGGNVGGSQDFSIEELAGFWRINGVEYKNEIYQVDVSKTLLPSGIPKEHAQRRKEALTNGGFYAPDYPLLHGVMNALCQNREGSFNGKIEEARTSLSDLVNDKWLMTLTGIRYAPHGQDLVIHNYGQYDKYGVFSNVVGPDGDIQEPETNAGAALQALLGTQQSPQEINQVYRWLRGTDFCLLRINTGLQKITEIIAMFDASFECGSFICCKTIPYVYASLGVRARKIW